MLSAGSWRALSNRKTSLAMTGGVRTTARAKLNASARAFAIPNRSPAEIVARGYSPAHVRQVVRLIKINEYKRRQAAVGIRITPRGFGRDWRYPITSAWNEWEALVPAAANRRAGATSGE